VPGDTATEQTLFARVAEAVQSDKCILFAGAGVHAKPPEDGPYAEAYPEAARPPIGAGLAVHLAERSNWSGRYPDEEGMWQLQRISLDYEIEEGRSALEAEVRTAVQSGKEPSPIVRALARMNFPIIVTTNYDRLIESALQQEGKTPEVRIYKPRERIGNFSTEVPESPRKPWLYKIHGDVGEPGSLVITDEDYINFVINMSRSDKRPVPDALAYLFVRRPTLFVGFSLLDYNLRLLFRTLRIGWDEAEIPRMYSVDYRPDPLIKSVWENRAGYIRFIAQDVWKFVPELHRAVTGEEMPL
jgi:SIR2-like domain